MSVELLAILVTSLLEITGLVFLGIMVYRMWEQTSAVLAATFLQGRRMEEILKEVKQELARSH